MNKELNQLLAWVISKKNENQQVSSMKHQLYMQGYRDALQAVRNEIHNLNEKTVNEANRTIDLIDKLKQHSGIRIPYDSKIVADWLLNQL